jgi:electron transfer flavoprotein beta subunit
VSSFHIVVCAGIVPDPLQTLEPVAGPAGPSLKHDATLPAVLDPWAAHALYEAAALARDVPGSRIWLVSVAPRARLQQVMMSVAQKAPFDLVAIDGPSSGFLDASRLAGALASGIEAIADLDRSRLLVFGGWESASRCSGATLLMVGERLGIADQFAGVDRLTVRADGALEILERVEGGRHQASVCPGPPALLAWATGSRPEPANSPQIGMANMRTVLPALQKARPLPSDDDGPVFTRVSLPPQRRQTRVVRDVGHEEVAREILSWMTE